MGKIIYFILFECGHTAASHILVKVGRRVNCPECMAHKRVVKCEQLSK